MKYSEMRSYLKSNGFTLLRQARGTHEIWRSEKGTILVTRNGLPTRRSKQNWLKALEKISTENFFS